jgi:hypothetical protein
MLAGLQPTRMHDAGRFQSARRFQEIRLWLVLRL